MATVPQAPFYAPRPSDDPCWQWVAPPSDPMRILSAQKFFGAGGQPPTRRWAPFFIDEPAVSWMPAFQNGPVRVTLTQTKFFGQNGQVVTRRWAPFYVYDETPAWAPALEWLNSGIMQQLGHKPFARQWTYNYDSSEPWVPVLEWLNSAAIQQLAHKPFAKLWRYDFDSSEPWMPTLETLNSSAIQQLAHKPFNKLWRYDYDSSEPWAPTLESLNSGIMQQLGHKPFAKQWRYDFDDAAITYTWINRNNVALQPSAAVPFFNFVWSYNFDDAALWSPTLDNRNANIMQELFLAGKPFAHLWTYNFDDLTSSWQWTPPNTIISQMVLYRTSGMSVIAPDDAPIWTYNTIRNQPLNATPAVSNPFSPRFIPSYDDPPGWTGGLRSVPQTITFTSGAPFIPPLWHFNTDDPSTVWDAKPRSGFFTQKFPVSFVSAMWNLNIPQDTPASLYSQPAAPLYLPAPVGTTLIQRTLTGVGL